MTKLQPKDPPTHQHNKKIIPIIIFCVQRSAVRYEQTECVLLQLWLPFPRGDKSLFRQKWDFLPPVEARGRNFLIFGTDLGTHTGLLFAKFQKISSGAQFFMDDSRAKNGPFWGPNQFFWGTAGHR
jgi:hypothetical protein